MGYGSTGKLLRVDLTHGAVSVEQFDEAFYRLYPGGKALGMRPEAVELMRQQFGALRNVYQLFVERTGLRLREVERLLAE